MATSLSVLLNSCGSKGDEELFNRFVQAADEIVGVTTVPRIMGTMAVGNLLLETPRRPVFRENLTSIAVQCKADFKFNADLELPNVLQQMYQEATTEAASGSAAASPGVAMATAETADEFSAQPEEGTPAKKAKLVSAAQKLSIRRKPRLPLRLQVL